jgi:CBS domain-containing protein
MTAVREVMTEQLVTVEPSTSVAAAVTIMGIQRVGAVLVMEDARLEGIFTERDLVRTLSYDIGNICRPSPGNYAERTLPAPPCDGRRQFGRNCVDP